MLLTLASLNLKSISHAPDCLDILWLGCVKLNLLTNLFDMYRNGRNISDRLHIPDFTEQLFFCEYMVWMLRKEGQQIKFFCGKCFFFSIYPHTACCLIDLDAADLYDIILRQM